jgi:acylphosphatase
MKQANINISGLVQGVFFRSETQDIANKLGIAGWVKNESDGSVSIRAQGEEDALNKFISWCKKGPPGAEVQNININFIAGAQETFENFEIRY